MKSLADFPQLVRALRAHPDQPIDPESVGTTFVLAPCCGRKTTADTILDVRGVPGTVVRGGNHNAPRDHDWLCDGCVHLLYADASNQWTRSRLFSAMGAAPELVRRHRARELADEQANRDFAAGRGHRPEEAHAAALAFLPPGVDPHHRGGLR